MSYSQKQIFELLSGAGNMYYIVQCLGFFFVFRVGAPLISCVGIGLWIVSFYIFSPKRGTRGGRISTVGAQQPYFRDDIIIL